MNRLFVLFVPLMASIAAQSLTGATAADPVSEIARSILNLGVGGLLAWIFFQQWKAEEKKREAAELRERQLLRSINGLPAEQTAVNDETLSARPALHIVDTQQADAVHGSARG